MKPFRCSGLTLSWSLGFLLALVTQSEGQVLTVQVGSAPPPPAPLVNHGDTWQYRKGTNAPQVDWKTASDAALDGTWLTGPGGFGYEDNDDATVLSDMLNRYNTVYIRRSFVIPEGTDPSRRVRLTMDWDDGFVAYLNGAEVMRSANVAVQNPLFDSRTAVGQNHESSAGGGAAPTTYDLGSVGSLLAPGTHVLAIHGLNAAPDSSDLSLIADLALTGGSQAAGGGPLFAIVDTPTVPLSGTNTFPGATWVTVNGELASFNPLSGEWSRLHTLSFGLNRLFIAAHDSSGAILASINRDVIFEPASVTLGGVLSADVVLGGQSQTYRVTSDLIVPAGRTLTLSNGVVVLISPGVSIIAETNGTVAATGSRSNPVVFAPADGTTSFGDLSSRGSNARLELRHVEVIGGQVRTLNGGVTLVEDSTVRDLPTTGREIIAAVSGAQLTVRRSHISGFGEIDSQNTGVLIEDCLIENFLIDGLDIKTTNSAPLVVRRSTMRFGDPENDNADALDFGPGAGTVEACLIHDFPDKGVSIGGAPGTVVRDSVIYRCGIGISAYSSGGLVLENSTISDCLTGVLFRNNPTPAIGVATNLIVWDNADNVTLTNTAELQIFFSDIQGSIWPGQGNINADPLFVNAGSGDFRLAAGSPAIGTGFGGANMGARFPVGGLPPEPRNLAAVVLGTNEIQLVWHEDAGNEVSFLIERRQAEVAMWSPLASVDADETTYTDDSAVLNQRYFYRVTAINGSGSSRPSNPASAIRQQPTMLVGGILPANTVWSPALGTIVVGSTVIVPSGVTLTVLPGTVVKLTNNASIVAAGGGVIDIAGTLDNKVQLSSLNSPALWGQLSAQFAGSSLTLRHADVSGGQITVYSNAVGVLEDSFIHDYRRSGGTLFTSPIILTHFAAPTAVRRCHVREYHETLWRNGVITIEDSLFEEIHGDAVDFDAAQPGTAVRRCTFRHGNSGNVDAVDVGPADLGASRNVVIEDSLMYDFPFDKGVSCGDAPNPSLGTVVRNCLIYNCLSGVMSKDNSHVAVSNCTIVFNNWGFTNYNKANPSSPSGGGHTTNVQNNILWGNDITISMANASTLTASYNIFSDTNWPGTANIDIDPLFVNAAQHDYRLAEDSPARGAGRDGSDLGARFPVGAPMALSHPRIESFAVANGRVVVRFWADSERTYSVLSSDVVAGGTWVKLADVPTAVLPRFLSFTNTVSPNNGFYRLVSPALP